MVTYIYGGFKGGALLKNWKHAVCIGKTYFFKGKSFYEFNDRRMRVVSETPSLSAPFWMSCPTGMDTVDVDIKYKPGEGRSHLTSAGSSHSMLNVNTLGSIVLTITFSKLFILWLPPRVVYQSNVSPTLTPSFNSKFYSYLRSKDPAFNVSCSVVISELDCQISVLALLILFRPSSNSLAWLSVQKFTAVIWNIGEYLPVLFVHCAYKVVHQLRVQSKQFITPLFISPCPFNKSHKPKHIWCVTVKLFNYFYI